MNFANRFGITIFSAKNFWIFDSYEMNSDSIFLMKNQVLFWEFLRISVTGYFYKYAGLVNNDVLDCETFGMLMDCIPLLFTCILLDFQV